MGSAEAIVGSPEFVPADGSFYGSKTGLLSWISNNLNKSPNEIAKNIAQINFESFLHGGEQHNKKDAYHQYLCYSAVDQSAMPKLMESLRDLFSILKEDKVNIDEIRKYCLCYGSTDHYSRFDTPFPDLIDLINNIPEKCRTKKQQK